MALLVLIALLIFAFVVIPYTTYKDSIHNERLLKIGSKWVNIREDLNDPWEDIESFEVTELKKNYKNDLWVKGIVSNKEVHYSTHMPVRELFMYYTCTYSPD